MTNFGRGVYDISFRFVSRCHSSTLTVFEQQFGGGGGGGRRFTFKMSGGGFGGGFEDVSGPPSACASLSEAMKHESQLHLVYTFGLWNHLDRTILTFKFPKLFVD